jgi:hypothetical protein
MYMGLYVVTCYGVSRDVVRYNNKEWLRYLLGVFAVVYLDLEKKDGFWMCGGEGEGEIIVMWF